MSKHLFVCAVVWASFATAAQMPPKLVVHEWGTFTALQDESGQPIGGINTDDEPLPYFVHSLGRLIAGPSEAPSILFKGVPKCDRDVWVRLETPVVYFHLTPKDKPLLGVDVDVKFNGGWLTQFYPTALAGAPGIDRDTGEVGDLTEQTTGTLSWPQLQIGGTPAMKPTDSQVWLAARQVDAEAVQAGDLLSCSAVQTPESEKYLFYRGVGHLRVPVSVSQNPSGGLVIRNTLDEPIGAAWLVLVKPDGSLVFRLLGKLEGNSVTTTPATFEFSAKMLDALRKSLREAIIADGMNADEANALLNTWETSYFKRPGLRLFFMTPRSWTDRVLPLKVKGASQIERTMIGRVEIVTPEQRQLLSKLAASHISSPQDWLTASLKHVGGHEDYYREDFYMKLLDGQTTFSQLHAPLPDDYRTYLELGRFRNALLLDEQARRPSPGLAEFIKSYDLGPSR